WELPDGPVTVQVARSSRDVVTTREITIPRAHLAAHPVPAAIGDRVPAARAEETDGLARCAATLLEGTELRPVTGAVGTADFVLDAGTTVISLETSPLDIGALELAEDTPGTGSVELIAPEATDPSFAPAPPLPHRVPALGTRSSGRVRVRLTGTLAVTGLRAARRCTLPDPRRSPVKFTNGYWLIRDGVTLQRPSAVHDIEFRDDELVVHAPDTRILSRGDTLIKPVISVSFTAPRPDVF